ncbi:hypothetical protein AX17_000078 [Amanita inopinata Kibby_2008]|nr:hypothetical protein AX17_000078 [Amanita inopinata Kibby_2008]
MLLAVVAWPAAPFTHSLALKSIQALSTPVSILSSPPQTLEPGTKLLQWSSYDEIDHELAHLYRTQSLSSSYTIRKALIRKHFLSNCIRAYITKHPTSPLVNACPQTYEIEISFADELDEQWTDELWELAQNLDRCDSHSWWILKPGMADRGMGIRLFNSKRALQSIFESFESDSDEDASDGPIVQADATSVVTSQLRYFVIQEYIQNPLLIDPSETGFKGHSGRGSLEGYKFHLRAYCVAKGALDLFLYDHILALFSAVPYKFPSTKDSESDSVDLLPHLTNTSLQTHRGDEGVRLLRELVGCQILSGAQDSERVFTNQDVEFIIGQMSRILCEVFRAALQVPVHFQATPNSFELFGVDFLIMHDSMASPQASPFIVKLLEINAEPAIELTGSRLSWIIEDLFTAIGKVCVDPFFSAKSYEDTTWLVGDTSNHLIKCMEERVRA